MTTVDVKITIDGQPQQPAPRPALFVAESAPAVAAPGDHWMQGRADVIVMHQMTPDGWIPILEWPRIVLP